jgi:hypothetical protein
MFCLQETSYRKAKVRLASLKPKPHLYIDNQVYSMCREGNRRRRRDGAATVKQLVEASTEQQMPCQQGGSVRCSLSVDSGRGKNSMRSPLILPANYISDVVVSAVARENQSEELAPIWFNRGDDPTFRLFAVDNIYRRTWPSDISKVPGGPGSSDIRLSGISKPPLQIGITELSAHQLS